MAARTTEMAGDDFSVTVLQKNTQDPRSGTTAENCLGLLNGASSNVTELDCYVGFQEASQ